MNTPSSQSNHYLPKESIVPSEIAVIGLSGRYPLSANVDELWRHLACGDDLIRPVSRWDLSQWCGKECCHHGGFLEEIDRFDPEFFNISKKDAIYMDPQQRLLLEEAWKALEDAGYAGNATDSRVCGVYVGYNGGDYSALIPDNAPGQAIWANSASMLSARVAQCLNLHGPAITLDTSCSSSLVAIHLACQGLWMGEIELALAAGVFIQCTPAFYALGTRTGMLSASGRCHAFDEKADGIVPGEGVGVLVLKRLAQALAEGDHIYGVIRGSAINHDGAINGIAASSAASQERLQRQVYETFRIRPEEISMVEAHAAATKEGDATEWQALGKTFCRYTERKQYCAIGSIKTNIGHTTAAAGIASATKVLLSLQHRQIPPSLHYDSGNSSIQFSESPFYVNTRLREWTVEAGGRRCAAINSLGQSGTNAHMIMAEPPQSPRRHEQRPAWLVVLSARTREQLRRQVEQFLDRCRKAPDLDLGNLSHTLLLGRRHFGYRLACVTRNLKELAQRLDQWLNEINTADIYVSTAPANGNAEQPLLTDQGNLYMEDCCRLNLDEQSYLNRLSAVAYLYAAGLNLRYEKLFCADHYSRISLPTYPFAGERYWIQELETPATSAQVPADTQFVEQKVALPDATAQARIPTEGSSHESLQESLTRLLKQMLASVLNLSCDAIEADVPFQEFGLDSIMMGQIINELEEALGPLSDTLLFDCQNIEELRELFLRTHAMQVKRWLARKEDSPSSGSTRQSATIGPAAGSNLSSVSHGEQLPSLASSHRETEYGAPQEKRQLLVPGVHTLPAETETTRHALKPCARPEHLPLSFAQERLWFINELQGASPEYNMPETLRLRGRLHRRILQQAIQTIIDRHEILRTRFVAIAGQPFQIIDSALEFTLPVEDLTALDEEQQRVRLIAIQGQEWEEPFDLAKGPLLRLKLLKMGKRHHLLVWNFHHIVYDLWSHGVFEEELRLLYAALSEGRPNPLPPLPIQYADYVLWQRHSLNDEATKRDLAYWKNQLAGIPEQLEIPKDRPPERLRTFAGEVCLQTLPAEKTAMLKKLGRLNQATLYMTLLSGFAALLSRYTGQEDIIIGSPIANRQEIQLEKLIGFFVNSLVMRARVCPDKSFTQLLAAVRATCLEAYRHQDIRFEQLVEELSPRRVLNTTPIYQVTFALQIAAHDSYQMKELEIEPVLSSDWRVRFDMELHAREHKGEIELYWLYNRQLFDGWRVRQMLRHYVSLLEAVIEDPEQMIGNISLLSAEERQQLIVEWNRTDTLHSGDLTLPALFEQQAERTPQRTALMYEDQELTYSELNFRANQMARFLRRLGVGPEVRVGICLERSLDLIVAVLAVMKAGGAYVPLDPSSPAKRLAVMLEDAGALVTLVRQNPPDLSPENKTRLFSLDAAGVQQISSERGENFDSGAHSANLAYVIFTSGSTGRPKGVAIEHRSALNLEMALRRQVHSKCESKSAGRRGSLNAPLVFDASVQQLLLLLSGHALVIVPEHVRQDSQQFVSFLRQKAVDILDCTPSQMESLLYASLLESAPPPDTFLVGGEAIGESLWRQLHASSFVQAHNVYGPTECTVDALSAVISSGTVSPVIGGPLSNTRVYVLDQVMGIVPVGVTGELYIGGNGLARGYFNEPLLTAERFVPNPFSQAGGERLYRTGDLVRWRPDGNLEFLGRCDHQVKIRGYRIELGEIETVLNEHAAVRQAAVVAREDRLGEKQLVAYVAPRNQSHIDAAALRGYLKERLPDYMAPADFVVLETLPLTVNGKLDRKALPAPELHAAPYAVPRTPQEEVLCTLFAGVLCLERVGIHDNFFLLGGHSLLATRLVSRIRAALKIELALRTLFESPTVAELAICLEQAESAPTSLARRTLRDHLPLSYAQQRLWFIDRLQKGSPEYNMPEALRLRGRLNRRAVEQTVQTIVQRHESLRTRFIEVDGQPVQVILPELQIKVSFDDLEELENALQWKHVLAAMQHEWEESFDLAHGPLLRIKLLKLAEQDHVLLQNFHHIIFDGWSAGVFAREFTVLYEAFSQGLENPLPALPVQYGDFTLWQRSRMNEDALARDLQYWKDQLAGIPAQLELPKDRPRRHFRTFAADVCHLSLQPVQLNNLKGLSQSNEATLYMLLLSVFALLLERYSGQQDIVVGSPIANRQEEQLDQLIGFFVNSLVMRVRVNPQQSFQDLLASVREMALEAYQHQDLPFERIVEELSPERSLNATPIFQVMFALQNAPMETQRLSGIQAERIGGAELRVRFDLEVHGFEQDGGLSLFWLYNRDLFDRWRMEQMVRHFQRLLEAAATRSQTPLHQLSVLSEEERHVLITGFNPSPRPLPEITVPALFDQQAGKTPEATAVIFGEGELSYAQLWEQANCLAHHLADMGAGAEKCVAVRLERGPNMIVALLAVLKTGAAYVPLDLAYPRQRVKAMLADSQAVLLLTTSDRHLELAECETPVILLDQLPDARETGFSVPLSPVLNLDGLAYVMYTSGSTGAPKGTAVTHRSIIRLVCNNSYVKLEAGERIAQIANTSFDAATFEIWGALLNGGAVVVLSREITLSPPALARALKEHRIDTLFLTAALFNQVASDAAGAFSTVRNLLVGGEAVDPRWMRHVLVHGAPHRLLNAYGPTEDTTFSTWQKVDTVPEGASTVPIGRSIDYSRAYVLDRNLEPVPIGVTGELYLAGAGLARGYLGRPDQTAERFIPDPHAVDGSRMYRTGDLVRWNSEGALECIGRSDHQVKIRGFRIELEEIEANLKAHESVHDALVLVREHAGQKQLLGYVVAKQAETEKAEAQASYVMHWQELYQTTYRNSSPYAGDFNIVGWNSSYTGEPIHIEEMRLWVQETVAQLEALNPTRVLEIGCGTGLLLTRLAPRCERYVGLDFSREVLTQLGEYLCQRDDLSHVELRHGQAHELSFAEDDSFDLVILNSVVQYFPNIHYLLDVLAEAVRATRRGGHIFVGDVRSLPLLEAYHVSVQLHKAAPDTSLEDLRQRASQARHNEKELVVDPALFRELGRNWDKIGWVSTTLKSSPYDNELSRFRYAAILGLGNKRKTAEPDLCLTWDAAGQWQEHLGQSLALESGLSVGVRGISDLRVAGAVEAVRLLSSATPGIQNAGELRAICAMAVGEDPHAVAHLAERLRVEFLWQRFDAEGVYDVLFNPQWTEEQGSENSAPASYGHFANEPAISAGHGKLARALHEHLHRLLPEYMVPAAIMILPAWPLNANGKIDRRALPTPELRPEIYRAPRTPQEAMLCEIFGEVLGLEQVGIDDNFFELGGHSLMAMRLVSRIRATLGIELPLQLLFESATVAELAPHLILAKKARPPLVCQARPERLPLSYAQQRLWFIDQLEESSTEYNMPEALRVRGKLDLEALERTLQTIVERHESLRTHFAEVEGEPIQIIMPELRLNLPVEELSGLSEVSKQEAVRASIRLEQDLPFDLSRGPLLRMKLLRLSEQEYILLRTFHHIVSDGWSQDIFNREFMTLYDAFSDGLENPLPQLSVQYADFALWQRSWLDDAAMTRELEYWKGQLAGVPEQISLPLDHPRPALQTFAAEVCVLPLPTDQLQALKQLSQAHATTLYMTLLAAFAVLLYRYSGQEDIAIGTPIANRPETQLEQMIGFFVNSLVMRVRVMSRESFGDLLAAVRSTALEAFQHQDLPFERLVEALSPQRSLNTPPVFQVMFALQNAPNSSQSLKGVEIERISGGEMRVRFDLEVHAWENQGRVDFYWIYNRDLFDRWRIEQMARHFGRLLEQVAAQPQTCLSELSMLGDEERAELLEGRNRTDCAFPIDRCLFELLEQQAAKTPHAVAVIHGERSVTYEELNQQANALAHHLIGKGMGPDKVAGICMERSPEMVTALLAVLKAGGAYLPLDPEHPQARLARILEEARPTVILSTSDLRRRLPETAEVLLLDLPEEQAALCSARRQNPTSGDRNSALLPSHAAYIIYTSGSTGAPKGVVITQESVVSLLSWAIEAFGPQTLSHVLAATSLSFDVAVFEIFAPLLVGGSIEIVPNLLSLVERPKTPGQRRLISGVPSAFSAVLGQNALLDDIHTVVLAGEALPERLLSQIRSTLPHCRVANLYGPTETTVYATAWFSDGEDKTLSIGRPISNVRVYVLDKDMEPVATGVPGELYIGGHGIARGYLHRPDLTAERFLPDPYSPRPGTRMYRTGDVVRWRISGEIEYLGRRDHQVKIRGYRIELGEIESALSLVQGIRQCAVAVNNDAAGDKQLVGYVVPAAETTVDLLALPKKLRERLPEYMIPSAFVSLPALPLMPNGKLNRHALPAPEWSTAGSRAPRTAQEQVLCDIFAEVLGLESVGIDDNFFSLGGHSLKAMQVVSRVRSRLSADLTLRVFFESPTVGELATHLTSNPPVANALSKVLPLHQHGTLPPIFCLPGGAGLSWPYAALVHELGSDQPVYGLQASGIETEEPFPDSMEELAQEYLTTIRTIQPQGPYHLLGWSFGGLIAYAMACLLQQRHEDVALLALLDSYPVNPNIPTDDKLDSIEQLAEVMHLNYKELKGKPQNIAELVRAAREAGHVLGELEIDQAGRMLLLLQHSMVLRHHFRPRKFEGDLLFFAASGSPYALSPTLWLPYVEGQIDTHEIQGSHSTMIQPSSMAEIGRILKHELWTRSNRRIGCAPDLETNGQGAQKPIGENAVLARKS